MLRNDQTPPLAAALKWGSYMNAALPSTLANATMCHLLPSSRFTLADGMLEHARPMVGRVFLHLLVAVAMVALALYAVFLLTDAFKAFVLMLPVLVAGD